MNKLHEWKQHRGYIVQTCGEFELIDCQTCRFKHVVPIPDIDELEHVYRNEYYAKDKPLYIEGVTRDLDWWQGAYSDRYLEFSKYLQPGRRRILDVGSGPGFFLQYGLQQGWQVLGIEPSQQAIDHSRQLGVPVMEGFLDDDMARRLGKFDAIHMNNVLEHLPDPIDMLKRCHGLLDPGGILCVVAPNDFNPFQTALQKACNFDTWWVAPPHHINYFDFDSLERLLTKCQFEILARETTFPIDMFLLMGDNYIADDSLGRACHVKRMTFEKNLRKAGMNHVKRKMYQALACHGLGREIVLFAR